MSQVDIFSFWRCPNCKKENIYNLTWQHFYRFKEYDATYSKEKCDKCGKEYYVNKEDPNRCRMWLDDIIIKCKNDYVENAVIDIDDNLTVEHEYRTS